MGGTGPPARLAPRASTAALEPQEVGGPWMDHSTVLAEPAAPVAVTTVEEAVTEVGREQTQEIMAPRAQGRTGVPAAGVERVVTRVGRGIRGCHLRRLERPAPTGAAAVAWEP